MHIATSADCSIYMIMWLPFLIMVSVIGARSLYQQIRAEIRLRNIWLCQACALVATGVGAIIMHYVGLFQLNQAGAGERSENSNWFEDGMKIIRFVDTGYLVILGIGVLLMIATVAIGVAKSRHARQVAGDNGS